MDEKIFAIIILLIIILFIKISDIYNKQFEEFSADALSDILKKVQDIISANTSTEKEKQKEIQKEKEKQINEQKTTNTKAYYS